MADSDRPEQAFLQALGSELRSWRTRRGLTRAELARRASISASTLGRIERADGASAATIADVWRLADELGLAFSDVVRRAEEAVELASKQAATNVVPGRFGLARRDNGDPFAADAAAHHSEVSILDEQE